MIRLVVAVVATMSLLSADLVVSYTTLTDTGGFNPTTGWRLSDPGAPNGENTALELAAPFVATAGGPLQLVEFAVDRLADNPTPTTVRTISLSTDAGGQPGTVLESWSIVPTTTATLANLTSLIRPALAAGTKYWLTGHINPTGTASDYWCPNSLGLKGSVLYRRSVAAAWSPVSGTLPAFRVQVGGTVPPPNQPPVARISATPSTGAAPLTVAFSGAASSDPDGTITSYAWDFGDGATSTGGAATQTRTYNATGTYTAKLTVTDNAGAKSTAATATITVTSAPPPNQPPVARVTATPSTGTAPLTVAFSGATSSDADGTISTYAWDFGDGATAAGASATQSHTYSAAGLYTAKLTVTDNAGAKSTATAATITVSGAPTPVVVAYTTLTDTGGFNPSTGWRLSDPGSPNGENLALEVSSAFVVTATGPLQSVDFAVARLLDNPLPTSTRTISLSTDAGGQPGTVLESWSIVPSPTATLVKLSSLTRPALAAGTKYWLTGHINPTGKASDYWCPNSLGLKGSVLYRRSVTAPWQPLSGTLPAFRVQVGGNIVLPPNQAPVARITATPSTGAPPLVVAFSGATSSDPDGTISTYAWDFGDGATVAGGAATQSHTYSAAGVFTAKLTVTDNAGAKSSAATATITVTGAPPPNQLPVARITATPSSGTAPLTVAFSGAASSDADGTISTYTWDFGDGTTAAGALPTQSRTYNAAGVYTAKLTVTDNGGAKSTAATAAITVSAAPAPVLVAYTTLTDTGGFIPTTGWRLSDPGAPNGENTALELSSLFVATAGGPLQSVDFAVARLLDNPVPTTVRTISLSTDAGGQPGTVLESWNIVPTTTATLVNLASVLRPVLAAGTKYWLTGHINPIGTASDYWCPNSLGLKSSVLYRRSVTAAWIPVSGTLPAFRVQVGGTVTPPPNQPPVARVTATPSTGTAPLTVAFSGATSSDSDGMISSYAWDFGNGVTVAGRAATQSHTFSAAGVYIAKLTVTDNAGANSTAATVTITVTSVAPPNQPPVARVTATPNSGTAPLTVAFSGAASSDADGTISAYAWDFGDGATATGASATQSHAYSAVGVYTAKLTVTDNAGAKSTAATATVTVSGPAASVVVAYTTLTDTGGFNPSTGWRLSDPGSPNGENLALELSAPFVATASGPLQSVDFAVARLLDNPLPTSTRTISLSTDAGGQPGTVLESWSIVPTPTATLVNLSSLTRPALAAGTKYWLTGHINPTGKASDYWCPNSLGLKGSVLYRRSVTAAWQPVSGTLPAVRVKVSASSVRPMSSGAPVVLIDTFGPGDSVDEADAWFIGQAERPEDLGVATAVAVPFVLRSSFDLASIEAGISSAGQSEMLPFAVTTLSVSNDDHGSPGTPLESWSLVPGASPGTAILPSEVSPSLRSGRTYWLVVSADLAPAPISRWALSGEAWSGLVAWKQSGEAVWRSVPMRLPALRLLGTPTAQEVGAESPGTAEGSLSTASED